LKLSDAIEWREEMSKRIKEVKEWYDSQTLKEDRKMPMNAELTYAIRKVIRHMEKEHYILDDKIKRAMVGIEIDID